MDFGVTSSATPPQTPRRAMQSHDGSVHVNPGPDSVTKTRGGRKARPKNVNTSPIPKSASKATTASGATAAVPQSIRPTSTPTSTAYAGPTFHASPAPSALPIPSFYSKSVPESPGFQGFHKAHNGGSLKDDHSPVSSSTKMAAAREESPLDFIFNAHRQESRTSGTSLPGSPFQPPARSPHSSATTPVHFAGSGNDHYSRGSASSLFGTELDGHNSLGKPIGAAFSTPYKDRINAARAGPSDSSKSVDRSQALKAFLFSQQASQQPLTSSNSPFQDAGNTTKAQRTASTPLRNTHNSYPRLQEADANTLPRAHNRSSGLRQEVPFVTPDKIISTPNMHDQFRSPNTPSRGMNGSNLSQYPFENTSMRSAMGQGPPTARSDITTGSSELQGMEDTLRRMLNLGSANVQTPASSSHGLGSLPEASNSVPNYVGGRAPPMNGLHNGVMGS